MPDDTQGPTGGAVLIAVEDDKHDTVKPRIKAVGGNMSRIIDLSMVKRRGPDGEIVEYPFVLPDDNDSLKAAIKHVGAVVTIIDTLNSVLNSHLKIQNDQDTRQALTPLARIAEETGCAIVIIRHFTKEVRSDLIYQGAGNMGIIGAARSGLAIIPDPDNKKRHILVVSKHNLTRNEVPNRAFITMDTGVEEEAFVKWDGVEIRPVAELMGAGNLGGLKQRLLSYLVTNGKTTLFTFYQDFRDVAQDTMRKSLSELWQEGMIEKSERGVYSPKEQVTQPPQPPQTSQPPQLHPSNNNNIDSKYGDVGNVGLVRDVGDVGNAPMPL